MTARGSTPLPSAMSRTVRGSRFRCFRISGQSVQPRPSAPTACEALPAMRQASTLENRVRLSTRALHIASSQHTTTAREKNPRADQASRVPKVRWWIELSSAGSKDTTASKKKLSSGGGPRTPDLTVNGRPLLPTELPRKKVSELTIPQDNKKPQAP